MNSLENKALEDIKELVTEQQKHSNNLTSEIINLVKESTTATTTANGLNRELTDQLKGIKKKNLFDIIVQIGQIVFILTTGTIIVVGLFKGYDVKFGSVEVKNPITAPVSAQ